MPQPERRPSGHRRDQLISAYKIHEALLATLFRGSSLLCTPHSKMGLSLSIGCNHCLLISRSSFCKMKMRGFEYQIHSRKQEAETGRKGSLGCKALLKRLRPNWIHQQPDSLESRLRTLRSCHLPMFGRSNRAHSCLRKL